MLTMFCVSDESKKSSVPQTETDWRVTDIYGLFVVKFTEFDAQVIE